MIAMRVRKTNMMRVSKWERKEDREQKRRIERERKHQSERSPGESKKNSQRMEILQHERWRTEDFINVRRRKGRDWKTKDTHSGVNRRLRHVLYRPFSYNGFVPSSISRRFCWLRSQDERTKLKLRLLFMQNMKIASVHEKERERGRKSALKISSILNR